jgi:DNA (cytosine-5)-methyltransferase 1
VTLARELVIDSFAGGGGASTGIEAALGRGIDAAINHDPEAMALHAANHPAARHYVQNIWQVDPREVVRDLGGAPVGLAWFSPDCKHFSKAKGGQPVEKRIRDLAWVVVHWARLVRPRVIFLENVEEFRDWGPLIEVACDKTGIGRMMPCPARKGLEFRRWVRALRQLGYTVEHRELRACDFGAPTIRKRLFLVARRDGAPIVWPAPTHGPIGNKAGLIPYRTAAECIDWSIPCPSIFTRARPLAEATLRRIARGVMRYVVNAAEPFIVKFQENSVGQPVTEPLHTVMAGAQRFGVVSPCLVPRYGERPPVDGKPGQEPRCMPVDQPISTVVPTANGAALVAAFLAKHYGGHETDGAPARAPFSTVTARDHHAVVAAHITKFRGTSTGSAIDEPLHTVTANSFVHRPGGGSTHGLVSAFLTKYYGADQDQGAGDPLHTATAKARFGLVTVTIAGTEYVIVDIGMRMLHPRELFRAQGFPDSYVIDPEFNGKPLTKTAQIRMCGNSVCPPVAEAVVRANYAEADEAGQPDAAMEAVA